MFEYDRFYTNLLPKKFLWKQRKNTLPFIGNLWYTASKIYRPADQYGVSSTQLKTVIPQHMTTKIRILRVVFLNILPFRLRLIPRLARVSACFPTTFQSLQETEEPIPDAAATAENRRALLTEVAEIYEFHTVALYDLDGRLILFIDTHHIESSFAIPLHWHPHGDAQLALIDSGGVGSQIIRLFQKGKETAVQALRRTVWSSAAARWFSSAAETGRRWSV